MRALARLCIVAALFVAVCSLPTDLENSQVSVQPDEAPVQPEEAIAPQAAVQLDSESEPASQSTPSRIKRVEAALGLQNELQTGLELGVGRSAEGTVKPITEHLHGKTISTLQQEMDTTLTRQEQYNSDPWAVYGGERGLFCRIQYYHDTVEFSPSCELVDYNLVDPEFHKPTYNCQFFEQRGILYFYGERWIDCTPLSQRGKKVVFECGVQCSPRQGESEPIESFGQRYN